MMSTLAMIFGTLGLPELVIVAAIFAVWIVLLVWVYGDASRRGMDATLWVVIVFFLHLPGLVVYLVARASRTRS